MNPLLHTLQWKQDARNAWLFRAAEQVRSWRAEDEANEIIWNTGAKSEDSLSEAQEGDDDGY